jgi:tetratricopeptide (TPR) repeat protein
MRQPVLVVRKARPLFVVLALSWATVSSSALGQAESDAAGPPEPGNQKPAEDPAKAQAVDLFKRGMMLFRAGDVERALVLLLQSRKAYASKGNTLNAAICLDRLGRYDEALELYEEALARFGEALDAEDRASLPEVMARLRSKVASVEISTNVAGGIVLVDTRERGRVPLAAPLRVLPGRRAIRVAKDGYRTFERVVTLRAGASLTVEARLAPLESRDRARASPIEPARRAAPSSNPAGERKNPARRRRARQRPMERRAPARQL